MKKYFLLLAFWCLAAQAQQKTAYAYFDFNSDIITAQGRKTLDSISSEIKVAENYAIKIYGFTDDAGTDAYNNILAQRRADSVAAYFQLLGFATAASKPDTPQLRNAALSPEKKRRVRIVYDYKKAEVSGSVATTAVENYSEPFTTTLAGTNVVLTGASGPGRVTVNEYYSAESMIAGGMYAIADDGQILKTDGMVTVCNTYKTIDSTGTYKIEIPANRGIINKKASVWLSVEDDNGRVSWKNTDIEVTTDEKTKMYTIVLPAKPAKCMKINLDMLANRANGYRVVYLYTDKPYDFTTAKMESRNGDILFSAKINDTTWAFAASNRAPLASAIFKGSNKYGNSKGIGVQLRKCRHKVDKQRNHHYYITPKALLAGLPKPQEEKKKGLKGWWDNLF